VSLGAVLTPPRRAGRELVRATPRTAEPQVTLQAGGDWPHTTRVMPWLIAAFMAMLWLVPFNSISMTVSLPFQLHLYRIVLPAIVFVWGIALAAGGPAAPRLRLTAIHGAIAAYLCVAMLSVLVNVQQINQLLQLSDSIKHLVLLASYAMLFVIVASVVRRTELPAFLTYTLALCVLCALGTLWESRFHYNVFYDLSGKLLPSFFTVPQIDSSALDELGRATTIGPAEVGLETAAMLSMGLTIAMARLVHAPRWRARLVYLAAASLIIAAGLSTYRKTALIAPVMVILTFAFFRRKELLRLAPLGVMMVIAVHLFSPGALGGVVEQLSGSRLSTVGTTTHRVGAYEAIRPLVWSRPALGQGYGTYNAELSRVLDSQILSTTIETGVVGLAAYLLMIVAIIVVLLPIIRSRDRERAPPALTAAAAAVVFLTVSFTYDAMGFPHGPYILLTFAGFAAVLVGGGPTQSDHRLAANSKIP
jgi:hypothetical protein